MTVPLVAVISANIASCEQRSHTNSRVLRESSVADAVEKASPSVVNVTVRKTWSIAAGSGFIVSKDGFIVTNAHVLNGVSSSYPVDVTLWDGSQTMQGRVHSVDVQSDIALIKVDARGSAWGDLPVSKIGTSSTLRAGEFVIALGSPLSLRGSVTLGIISAPVRRALEMGVRSSSNHQFINTRSEYIQTDAAINQGNSGGPLCNLEGEVVGVNNLRAGAEGIGFAIPIDRAMVVVEQLKKNRVVVRPFIGLAMEVGRTSGKVEVTKVVPHSPAERAGLLPGDQLLEANGKALHGIADVYDAIGSEVGQEVELRVRRNGETSIRRVVSVADKPQGG